MKSPCLARRALIAAVLALAAAACATDRETRVPPEAVARMAPGLAAGITARDDLVLRFGAPSAEFEGGRIFTWRLVDHRETLAPARAAWNPDSGGEYAWRAGEYSLVVVFDAHNLAERFALVAVR